MSGAAQFRVVEVEGIVCVVKGVLYLDGVQAGESLRTSTRYRVLGTHQRVRLVIARLTIQKSVAPWFERLKVRQ